MANILAEGAAPSYEPRPLAPWLLCLSTGSLSLSGAVPVTLLFWLNRWPVMAAIRGTLEALTYVTPRACLPTDAHSPHFGRSRLRLASFNSFRVLGKYNYNFN